jgi:PhnB protein
MKLVPYLLFRGNCEEALNAYKVIFGGEANVVSRFGSTSYPVPESHKDKIMHASFVFDGNTIMMSDAMPESTIDHGNGLALSISLNSEERTRRIFEGLAENGKVLMPLEKQFWGALFGQVTDRFGIRWMVNCE